MNGTRIQHQNRSCPSVLNPPNPKEGPRVIRQRGLKGRGSLRRLLRMQVNDSNSPSPAPFQAPAYPRTWHQATNETTVKHGTKFRLMSYNILADYLAVRHKNDLYRSLPWKTINWPNRWNLILREIAYLLPDVLCLQEVDHFAQIQQDLGKLGYVGAYVRRTGDCQDGCATFWKSKFKLMDMSRICFNETRVLRDNVALICVLRHPKKGEPPGTNNSSHCSITVANTHVLFNPKRGDIKLGQVRILCDEVGRLSRIPRGGCFPSVRVIAGDFNSSPGSGIYQFMSQGSVSLEQYLSKTLAGTVDGKFSGSAKRMPTQRVALSPMTTSPADAEMQDASMEEDGRWWPDHRALEEEAAKQNNGSLSNCFRRRISYPYQFHWSSYCAGPRNRQRCYRSLRQLVPCIAGWTADQLEIAMGLPLHDILNWVQTQSHPFTLDHDLHLKSAYQTLLGCEPDATSLHDRCKNTLDYVFYSPSVPYTANGRSCFMTLEPYRILDMPYCSHENGFMKLPNEQMGSDHFSLCVDFSCRWTDNYTEAGLPLPPPTGGIESLAQAQPTRRPLRKRSGKRKPRVSQHSVERTNQQHKKQMK